MYISKLPNKLSDEAKEPLHQSLWTWENSGVCVCACVFPVITKLKCQSATVAVEDEMMLLLRGSLQARHSFNDDTPLNITSWLCAMSAPSGKHYSLPPPWHPNEANETNDKSISRWDRSLTLCRVPSLEWLICSANTLWEQKRAVLLMSPSCSSKCLSSSLTLLFIWKSLVLPRLKLDVRSAYAGAKRRSNY